MGDPKFFLQAISLESIFIALTILSIKKVRLALIPKHIDIMFSLTPFANAIILIIGGYLLQIMLISSSTIFLIKSVK